MQILMVFWKTVCIVVVWSVSNHLVTAAESRDPRFPSGVLSVLPILRPSKTVIRAVKREAPKLFMNLTQDVKSMGYPVETHQVHTEDGYILTVHRIPRGHNDNDTSPRPPVLLQHGLMGRSDWWVLDGPGIAPAYELVDRGYDVWMNNIRGNDYSMKHETLGRKDPRFWMFSWHESGYYDIPAVIDYILNITGEEKLFYVGHSMGNLVYYVAMSTKPEYNAKIRLQISLAPAVFLNEMESVPIHILQANAKYIKSILDTMPTYEFAPRTDTSIALTHLLCGEKAYFNKMCAVLLSWLVGTIDLNNTTQLELYMGRGYSGTSVLVLWHFTQITTADDFIMMDYGKKQNMIKYGSSKPPKYPLHNVTAPTLLFAADEDLLVPTKGVKRLSEELPNVVSFNVIREKIFNHLDFVIHPRKKELLWNYIFETMKRF